MPSPWNFSPLLLYISSWSDSWSLFFWHSLLLSPCSDLPNSWQLAKNAMLPLWAPLYVILSWMSPKLPSFYPLANSNPHTVCRCSQKHALIRLDKENHFPFWCLCCLMQPFLGGTSQWWAFVLMILSRIRHPALCKQEHALLIFLMSPLFTMMITDQLLNHYMLSQILDKWSYVRIENMGRYRTVF